MGPDVRATATPAATSRYADLVSTPMDTRKSDRHGPRTRDHRPAASRPGRTARRVPAGRDLTQRQLAKAAFCDRTTVTHIEKGRARADERFWQACDDAVGADGVLLAAAHLASDATIADALTHRLRATGARLLVVRPKPPPECDASAESSGGSDTGQRAESNRVRDI